MNNAEKELMRFVASNQIDRVDVRRLVVDLACKDPTLAIQLLGQQGCMGGVEVFEVEGLTGGIAPVVLTKAQIEDVEAFLNPDNGMGCKKVHAIKFVREVTGVGLREAKCAVEQIQRRMKEIVDPDYPEPGFNDGGPYDYDNQYSRYNTWGDEREYESDIPF